MAKKLNIKRKIGVPLDTVWRYATDLERTPEYWTNVLECFRSDVQSGEIAVGSHFVWRATMVGWPFQGSFSVREVVPRELLVYDAMGGISARLAQHYRALGPEETEFTLSVDYGLPFLLNVGPNGVLVEARNRIDVTGAVNRLKRILEGDRDARLREWGGWTERRVRPAQQ